MNNCEMLNVLVGFNKSHAEAIALMLIEGKEVIINPNKFTPKHIVMEGSQVLPETYGYVSCRMETRSLMSAARAAYAGEEVEFMRLYPIR